MRSALRARAHSRGFTSAGDAFAEFSTGDESSNSSGNDASGAPLSGREPDGALLSLEGRSAVQRFGLFGIFATGGGGGDNQPKLLAKALGGETWGELDGLHHFLGRVDVTLNMAGNRGQNVASFPAVGDLTVVGFGFEEVVNVEEDVAKTVNHLADISVEVLFDQR
jgi:hypothetical protein